VNELSTFQLGLRVPEERTEDEHFEKHPADNP
jgi:hypothetical protein